MSVTLVPPTTTNGNKTKSESGPPSPTSMSSSSSNSSGDGTSPKLSSSSLLLERAKQNKMAHQQTFFSVLAKAMHPRACLGACYYGHENHDAIQTLQLEPAMPEILDYLDSEQEEERIIALDTLHGLVNKHHTSNRIPVVCTTKWNVIGRLARGLSIRKDLNERRLICLILNNLSIPFDNKAVMILGEQGSNLIAALLKTISAGNPEAYLCCVCLMNLSILEDAKRILVQYVPPPSTTGLEGSGTETLANTKNAVGDATEIDNDPLKNPKSLLRSLEQMVAVYSNFLPSPVVSVEGQAVRWAMGLFRNLSTTAENAALLAQTTLPSLAGHVLQSSPRPLCKWTRDSLEDMTLSFLVQLVQFPVSTQLLIQQHKKLCNCLGGIAGHEGIHGVRADLIVSLLQKPKMVNVT